MSNDRKIDFIGLAQVLRTINEIREPSKLDLMDREYELRGREKLLQNKWKAKTEMLESYNNKYDALVEDRENVIKGLDKIHIGIKKLSPSKRSSETGENIKTANRETFGVTLKNIDDLSKTVKSDTMILAKEIQDLETLNEHATAGQHFYNTLKHNDIGGVDEDGYSIFDEDKDRILSTPERQAAIAVLVQKLEKDGQDVRGFKEGFWSEHNEATIQSKVKVSENQAAVRKDQEFRKSDAYKNEQLRIKEAKDLQGIVDDAAGAKNSLLEMESMGLDQSINKEETYEKQLDKFNGLIVDLHNKKNRRDLELVGVKHWNEGIWDQVKNPNADSNPFTNDSKIDAEWVSQGITEDWYNKMYKKTEEMATASGKNSDWDIKKYLDQTILQWSEQTQEDKRMVYELKNYWDKQVVEGKDPTWEDFNK